MQTYSSFLACFQRFKMSRRELGSRLTFSTTPRKHQLPPKEEWQASSTSSDLFRTSCGPGYSYGGPTGRVGNALVKAPWYPETVNPLLTDHAGRPLEVKNWTGWDQPIKSTPIPSLGPRTRKEALPSEARGRPKSSRRHYSPRSSSNKQTSCIEQLLIQAPEEDTPPVTMTASEKPAKEAGTWGTREIGTRLVVPTPTTGVCMTTALGGHATYEDLGHLRLTGKRTVLPASYSATFGQGMSPSDTHSRFETPPSGQSMGKGFQRQDESKSASRFEDGGVLAYSRKGHTQPVII